MKTLEQIKNDYAVSKEYSNWNSLVEYYLFSQVYEKENNIKMFANRRLKNHIDAVMKIYAMECLKLASDNVTTVHHKLQTRENVINAIHFTKHSITNENNIIK